VRGDEGTVVKRRGPVRTEDSAGNPEAVRVRMLGGFSVSDGSRMVGEDYWRLKKAASLVKLLAFGSPVFPAKAIRMKGPRCWRRGLRQQCVSSRLLS
jgi:hypothetical protein